MLFLGEARPSGVVAGSETAKGEFDRKCVERSGTVLARPFLEIGMAWMATVLIEWRPQRFSGVHDRPDLVGFFCRLSAHL